MLAFPKPALPARSISSWHYLQCATKCCTTCALSCSLPFPEDNKQHLVKAGVWQGLCAGTVHSFSWMLPAVILPWTTSQNFFPDCRKKKEASISLLLIFHCVGEGVAETNFQSILQTSSEFQMHYGSQCTSSKKIWVIIVFDNHTGNCSALSQIWSSNTISKAVSKELLNAFNRLWDPLFFTDHVDRVLQINERCPKDFACQVNMQSATRSLYFLHKRGDS